ncbi:MAG: hypothetical protein RSA48_03710 [Bacilli bacterium]
MKDKKKVYTNDIYIKVDNEIVKKGFWEQDLSGKKALVIEGLTTYTLNKMAELNIKKYNSRHNLSLEAMFILISRELISPLEREEFFRHYTHYIIAVASVLQSKSIIWTSSNLVLENDIIISLDSDGKWNELVSNELTPPEDITLAVINRFNQDFKQVNYQYQKKNLY